MMPGWRNPVSRPVRSFMPRHSRRLSIASGISLKSRPMVRHQPQLRLDCSPPMRPFSHRATERPFSARNKRRRDADDAAADHHDAYALRQVRVGLNEVDRWRHDIPWSGKAVRYPDSDMLTTEDAVWRGVLESIQAERSPMFACSTMRPAGSRFGRSVPRRTIRHWASPPASPRRSRASARRRTRSPGSVMARPSRPTR